MTDDERAEEYVNKRPFIHLLGRNTFFIQKEFKDAILWALAEGRKEKFEQVAARHKAELQEVNEQNDKLYEENKELKAQVYSSDKNVFAELNNETAESNARLIDEVADLKEQNEKMKCCGNCKNTGDTGVMGCFCYIKNEYIYPHYACEHWEMEEDKDV